MLKLNQVQKWIRLKTKTKHYIYILKGQVCVFHSPESETDCSSRTKVGFYSKTAAENLTA